MSRKTSMQTTSKTQKTLSNKNIQRSSSRALKTCLEARTCLENENPCLEKSGSVLQFSQAVMLFYINIPFKLIVSDALRIAIKHGVSLKNYFIVLFGCPINLIYSYVFINKIKIFLQAYTCTCFEISKFF